MSTDAAAEDDYEHAARASNNRRTAPGRGQCPDARANTNQDSTPGTRKDPLLANCGCGGGLISLSVSTRRRQPGPRDGRRRVVLILSLPPRKLQRAPGAKVDASNTWKVLGSDVSSERYDRVVERRCAVALARATSASPRGCRSPRSPSARVARQRRQAYFYDPSQPTKRPRC